MLRQQYEEDHDSDDFSYSSGLTTDEEDLLEDKNYRMIDNALKKLEEETEDLKATYEADPEGYKHLRPFFSNCKFNKKRAAAEMLLLVPSQSIVPVVQQKHIIERPNKFFDVNQQKYVEYKVEMKKKGHENETSVVLRLLYDRNLRS